MLVKGGQARTNPRNHQKPRILVYSNTLGTIEETPPIDGSTGYDKDSDGRKPTFRFLDLVAGR